MAMGPFGVTNERWKFTKNIHHSVAIMLLQNKQENDS